MTVPKRITLVLEADAEPPAMWCVRSPEVPGLNTQGATLAEALEMAADAVRVLGVDTRADEATG